MAEFTEPPRLCGGLGRHNPRRTKMAEDIPKPGCIHLGDEEGCIGAKFMFWVAAAFAVAALMRAREKPNR